MYGSFAAVTKVTVMRFHYLAHHLSSLTSPLAGAAANYSLKGEEIARLES